MIRDKLLGIKRRYKRMLQMAVDVLLVWLALWLAFVVRLGTDEQVFPVSGHLWLFLIAPVLSIPVFIRLGMYRAVLRYMGNEALVAIFKAVSLSTLLLALAIYWFGEPSVLIPRSLVIHYWWISLLLLGGLRLLMRQYFLGDWYRFKSINLAAWKSPPPLTRVAIYGAGAAGNQLLAALRVGRSMQPVAFLDDDLSIINRTIAGIKVYKPSRLLKMIEDTGAQEILLAMPSASRARRREILHYLEQFPLPVRSVPGFMDLASGKVSVEDLQEVEIADLLGRDPVPPLPNLFSRCITSKVVLVTGAGGSIGSELCRQIISQAPKVLILFEHSEYNLYCIHAELLRRVRRDSLSIQLVPVLGSIRNRARLDGVLGTWRVDTLYHAAAYKHVPLVEHNVVEGVLNNVLGTLNTAQAAICGGVKNFVLISTDKAVRPTNVMGSTKRLSEMILQALNRESSPLLLGDEATATRLNRTRFSMVRFGNVLDSSGSVIPIFRDQIRQGGPVTVTHPAITRYFMTIPEAAQLVIQAGSLGEHGELFVLDMGEPVKILDLAEKMIHLSGLSVRNDDNPRGDIAIEFTGLRPGEKLYEELLIGDSVELTEHSMIMCVREEFLPWSVLREKLRLLSDAAAAEDLEQIRLLLRELVEGYQPEAEFVDWQHQQRTPGTD